MSKRVVIIFVGLLLAAGAAARANRDEPPVPRTSFSEVPMQLGSWRGIQQPPLSKEVLAILGVDDYLTRVYLTPDRSLVDLYMGYWKSQRQGDTIHSPLNCLPGAGWEPVSKGTIAVTYPSAGHPSEALVNRYVIQKGLDRQLVLYWYQSHGRIVASEYWGKFYLIADAVRLNRTDGALVRVISPIIDDTPAAEQRAEQNALRFANELLPKLDGFLPL